jgi:hypothetical protein
VKDLNFKLFFHDRPDGEAVSPIVVVPVEVAAVQVQITGVGVAVG